MSQLTQLQNLLREEQSLITLIASYQDEIDSYNIDLAHAQRLLKEHEEVLNDNPGESTRL